MSLDLFTKNGLFCRVPETKDEDDNPKFTLPDESYQAEKFYLDNGFVVIRKIISSENCDRFINAFKTEVKPYKGYLYRKDTTKLEKNIFNKQNWLMNPILNIHSLNPKYFKNLRSNFEKIIASNSLLANFLSKVIFDIPAIVQSIYFEGNTTTWEHQDSYYLDDEETGNLIGAWLALEDIQADAGRFFVCNKSHLYDYSSMDDTNIVTKNHNEYVKNIVKLAKENNFKLCAPKLDKGDILFWNSLTIHGSMESKNTLHSRSSITFHIIKSKSKFKVFRNILRNLKYEKKFKFLIYRPKDQNKIINKAIYLIEKKFSSIFYRFKDLVIEYKVRKNQKSISL